MEQLTTLREGYWVALTLHEGVAPLTCYVGQVEEVDEQGVRLTLVDWMLGAAMGLDLFVPWREIRVALVATPDHSMDKFLDDAAKWQTAVLKSTEAAEKEPS